ncbi:transporter [Plakobranchus ocellatus]|uniref:Transporter n=1 Tax=Plakobranchus ocellatus TaxID=259542 RepID=A0AAV4DJR7_9GAST|nr:transporter [Plakobranchus ocellatus]
MSFKSAYQGGPYFELFSTQGRDFLANWKGVSSSKKIYEKEVKGYVLCLEGAPATTKIQSPKDQKQSLLLVQRFLVLQLHLSKGADFSMELGVTDLSNNKRRLLLSTAQKETQVTPLHAKIPLAVVRRAVWVNLVLDMVSLVGETWTSQTFRSVDQISVSANCKLRRIFTMKTQPPDTTDDDELYGCSSSNNGELDTIPKQCQIAPDVNHLTQVLTLNKIKCAERLRSGKGLGLADQFRPGSTLDLDLNASGRKITTSDGKIAFGSKAPRAPDTGRKSARQGNITTRSFRSQTSRIDALSNSNNSASMAGVSDSLVSHDGGGLLSQAGVTALGEGDGPRPRPPVSANAAMSGMSSAASSVSYSRQQSEPVTHDDFGFIANGMKGLMDKQLVAPHPPREPSNDRARRRPRIKSITQNGVAGRGDPSVISPPSSASAHAAPANIGPQSMSHQPTALSPGTASIRQRFQEVRVSSGGLSSVGTSSRMKDSGVGPDVPEIQSPRKGMLHEVDESLAYNDQDSVSDVISLLRGVEERIGSESGLSMEPPQRFVEEDAAQRRKRTVRDSGSAGRMNGRGNVAASTSALNERKNAEDNDSNVSTSASESSHLGEYEESDEETSGENKLHLFVSPPKSANTRRNISPSNPDAEANQSRKSFAKSFRSNIKRSTETASNRGARLEDDFVSHSSSDDDKEAVAAELLRHHQHHHHHNSLGGRHRRLPGNGVNGAGNFHRAHHNFNSNSSRGSSSGYNSANYTTTSNNGSVRLRAQPSTQQSQKVAPIASASPDQKLPFDPKAYADPPTGSRARQNAVSRMSRKSLREITNPCTDGAMASNNNDGSNKAYDFSKYTTAGGDLTESFEAGMFASMRRQTEAAYQDISPRPVPAPSSTAVPSHTSTLHSTSSSSTHQLHLNPAGMHNHLYSESPATTSDDDTSFSTWKAPAPNQAPHNYHDEMKSRRSSDTLTSSNPRDWSGVMSPPIMPLSAVQDLQGTMEGISDDLSDESPCGHGQASIALKPEEDEEKLDLLFDPKLNCYFDPKTNKWYELVT